MAKYSIEYIRYTEEQLRKLQREMLILLVEVDRICKKHNIPYYLSHGTLLGAVRHKGFIPWDDDIDIQMLRKDYEKFCDVCVAELDYSKFFLQTQATDQNYNWVYGKLRLRNTSFIRAGQEHLKQEDGFFMDIFPMDSITENRFMQKINLLVCKICRKILWSEVGKKTVSNRLKRSVQKFISLVPRQMTIKLFNYMATMYNSKSSPLLVCHNLSGHILKSEWYIETIPLEFEGYHFQAPKRYHDILTAIYGDYMQLPPIEKRQGHCYASFVKYLDGSEINI